MSTVDARPSWAPEVLGTDRLRQVSRSYPEFHPRAALSITCKTVLIAGEYHGGPAVLKVLTDLAPGWRARFAHEAAVYERFAASAAPPVRIPRLLAAPAPDLLLLEHMPGRPAAAGRYPDRPLPAAVVDVLLGVADALAGWTAAVADIAPRLDYSGRIRRYGPDGHGVLDADLVDRLLRLHRRVAAGGRWRFAHGDLLPANVLLTDSGTPVLLDWEYAGLYLAGYDHALLWIVLSADPGSRARIQFHIRAGSNSDKDSGTGEDPGADGDTGADRDGEIDRDGEAGSGSGLDVASGADLGSGADLDGDAFWLNVALLLAREIRVHREGAATQPALAARLRRLEPLAAQVRRELIDRI